MSITNTPSSLLATGRRVLVEAGEFKKIYDPSLGEQESWSINDHCIIRDEQTGLWHLFGITHAEPLHPMDEKQLAHACAASLQQVPWEKQAMALVADYEKWDEVHLWAPHVIRHDGLYYMFVCVGDDSSHSYKIHLATSTDLFSWERHPANPMIVDGFDARDPFVMRIGDQWVMYYTATHRPEGGNHIIACQTSPDLIHWSDRRIAFFDEETGTSGGSTESPSIIKRGDFYYLFICNNDRRNGYDSTDVYRSENPFLWSMDQLVGTIPAHAPEIVRDIDGKWYVTHCGWGRGGVHLAPLFWHDGLPD
jgi:hypothetical protein